MSKKKQLLIVSNTPSTNTQLLADTAVRGASHPDISNIEVKLLTPFETTAEDVMNCDAILLGTTENFGYMSGAMKDFFDRIFYPCLEHTEALPYAIYIRAGLDGTGTEIGMQKIISGLKWKQVQDLLLCHGEFKDEFVEQVEELGMSMAAGLEMGIF
ncbi:MAG: multimeric flavodoxin WrbA [Cocleimonas sp.]|jgi:multimeric flavodoxin WrbA